MPNKRGWKIFGRTVEVIAVVIAAGLLVLHIPAVQTRLVRRALGALKESLKAEITFSGIRFVPVRTLVLEDVAVVEQDPVYPPLDTVFSARKLVLTFSLADLLNVRKDGRGGVGIDRLRTEGLVFNYVSFDPDESGHTSNLTRAFGLEEDPERYPEELPDLFTVKRVNLDGSRVRMKVLATDKDYEYPGNGINWNDVDLAVTSARIRNMKYVGSRMSMDIDRLEASEKCGYSLSASGHMSTGMGLTEVTDARIGDAWSDLDIPYYAMRYERVLDFTDYINRIDMSLKLRRSRLAMKTISAYAGVFADCPVVLDIRKGSGSGPVNSLDIRGLEFTDLYSGTAADLDFVMTNLVLTDKEPEIKAEVRYLDFTSKSLTEVINAFAPDSEIDLRDFAKNVRARFSGKADGWLTHMVTNGLLETNYGNIRVDAATARIDTLKDNRNAFSFDGKLELDEADLGEFMSIDALGRTSMTITAAGDYNREVTKARVDTFRIGHIRLLDYDYQGIRGNGSFSDGVFDGNIISSDPNANLVFGGRVSTRQGKYGAYNASGDLQIANFDLEKTGLDKRGGGSDIKGTLHMVGALDTLGNIFGNVTGQDFRYITDHTENNIGSFTLSFNDMSEQGESGGAVTHKMTLNSPSFGRVSYRSAVPVTKFPEFVREAILCKYLPSLTGKEYDGGWEGHNFTIDVTLDDTQALLSPLKQDIYINSGTKMSVAMSKSGSLTAKVDCDNVRIGDTRIKGIQLSGSESGPAFRLRTVGPVTVSMPDYQITDINLSSSLLKDSLTFEASALSSRIESARLALEAGFYRDTSDSLAIRGRMGESDVVFGGEKWTFRKGSFDYHTCGDLSLEDMGLYYGGQNISVEGTVSRNNPAEMILGLEGFDLSIINSFLSEDSALTFGGLLSGEASYRTPLESNAGLDVNLECPALKIAGADFGSLRLAGSMDDEFDGRINFSAVHTAPDGTEDIRIRESESRFDLNSKNINATAILHGLDPALAQPLLKEAVDFGRGSIDGKICVNYTLGAEKMDLSRTYISLGDTLTVLPTGVRYALDGDIRGDRDGLDIRGIVIKDFHGGSARISGRPADLGAVLSSLEVVSDKGTADIFSGHLYASGDVGLRAEEDNTYRLGANLTTARSGELTVSLAGMVKEEQSTLTFIPPPAEVEEEEEEVRNPQGIKSRSDEGSEDEGARLIADVSVTATPGVRLRAEIDGGGDNAVTVSGQGTVKVSYDTRAGDVVLGGDYTIRDGHMKLSAAGIFSRDFQIEDGSSVRFAGDVMDTDLDLTASNTIRTSVGTLISDTTSVSNLRDVICRLSVSDRLKNPKLDFSIDIPDLDPTTAAQVQGELNTEDKVQKQFLALVATGSFLPGSQGGIDNQTGTGLIVNNLASIASGQLSSLLQRAGIPVDLGINYAKKEVGNDLVDVNLSTQFFGNRVLVTGSVGNRQYSTTSSDNVVGDIDVEVKIDKSGRLRAKLFSHSADDLTNYLDNSQRSGAGISYQREFNTFRDFFSGMFRHDKQGTDTQGAQKTLEIE